MDTFVTPVLALIICGSLAVTETVELELLRVIGLVVTSIASTFAAWLSYRNVQRTKRVERKVDRDRKSVRETVNGDVIVIEERRRSSGERQGEHARGDTDA